MRILIAVTLLVLSGCQLPPEKAWCVRYADGEKVTKMAWTISQQKGCFYVPGHPGEMICGGAYSEGACK